MEAVEFGALASNGIIEIPFEYRKDYSTEVRVILIKNNYSRNSEEPGIQERIAAAERLVGITSQNAMTLKDIKNERLSRQ